MRLPDPARSYAVLIGTSTYSSNELTDLPAVEGNLNDLYKVLTDPQLGAFPADHCRVVLNPLTAEAVSEELHRCAELAGDTLLLYFASHGLPGLRSEDLYLAMTDTKPAYPRFSALRYDDVRDVFLDRGRFPAANRVVILDCCFSGRAIPSTMSTADVVGMIGIEGTYILTATSGHVPALALSQDGLHTVFTGELIKLLHDGISGGPELLTLDAVYHHISKTMRARGLPLPDQVNRETVASLALARNSACTFVEASPANIAKAHSESTLDNLCSIFKGERVERRVDRVGDSLAVATQSPHAQPARRRISGLAVGVAGSRGKKFVELAAAVVVIVCGFLAITRFGLLDVPSELPPITPVPTHETAIPSGPGTVTATPQLDSQSMAPIPTGEKGIPSGRQAMTEASRRPTTGGSSLSPAPPAPDIRPTAPVPTTVPNTGRTELFPGEQLAPGEQLHSPDGRFVLVMQLDGNLVQRAPGNQPVWSSNTFRPNSIALMQPDGNFVVIAPGNIPQWTTGTSRYPNSVLQLQNDGNFVVYSPGHVARWASFDHGSKLPSE